MTKIQQIQAIIGTKPDGIWGPKSQAAFLSAINAPLVNKRTAGNISSFADPADIKRFKVCKDQGGSDQECFAIGDNGIGKWGQSTVEGTGPSCALPYEDWQEFLSPNTQKVLVTFGTRQVVCMLKDTLPHKAHLKHGVVIDINPDACKALGLTPPILVSGTWEFID